MYNEKRILAIIPARGGSKGLPGKNIRPLLGKPLLCYAIEALRASRFPIDIVLSTDSREIAEVGMLNQVEIVPRPAELAADSSMVIDAIKYTIEYLESRGRYYDFVLLIEATSPLRDSSDIDESIEAFVKAKDADCLATFSKLEHPVTRLWNIEEDRPTVFVEGADPFKRRQEQEYVYYINGLVYIMKIDTLKTNKTKSIFSGNVIAQITSKPVIDIDDEYDFFLAEQVLKYKKNKDENIE